MHVVCTVHANECCCCCCCCCLQELNAPLSALNADQVKREAEQRQRAAAAMQVRPATATVDTLLHVQSSFTCGGLPPGTLLQSLNRLSYNERQIHGNSGGVCTYLWLHTYEICCTAAAAPSTSTFLCCDSQLSLFCGLLFLRCFLPAGRFGVPAEQPQAPRCCLTGPQGAQDCGDGGCEGDAQAGRRGRAHARVQDTTQGALVGGVIHAIWA
jgi:hypothetical protein